MNSADSDLARSCGGGGDWEEEEGDFLGDAGGGLTEPMVRDFLGEMGSCPSLLVAVCDFWMDWNCEVRGDSSTVCGSLRCVWSLLAGPVSDAIQILRVSASWATAEIFCGSSGFLTAQTVKQ